MSTNREINIAFNAETKTAQSNAERLAGALNVLQERIGENIDRLKQLDGVLMSGNDKLTEASVRLGGSVEELEAFGTRMESTIQASGDFSRDFTALAKTADKLAAGLRNGSVSLDEARGRAEGIKETYKTLAAGMQELGGTAKTLAGDMNAARQALLEGALSPAQSEAVAKLNEQLATATELLRQLKESGSSTVIDAAGAPHGVHDLAETLTKLKEAKAAIMEGGDLSAWLDKWKTDTADACDTVVEAYTKAAKKEEAAHEKATTAAQKRLEKLNEAAELEQASIDELTARLEELTKAREKAQESGDVVQEAKLAEAIKKTAAELEKKQRAYDKTTAAAEKAAQAQAKAAQKTADEQTKATERMTRSVSTMARAMFTGTLSARTLATSIRGIGTAIKTGLGPIGWGIILVEGLIWALQSAWDWLKKLYSDHTAAAKKAEEEQKRILDEAIKNAEKAKEEYEGFIAKQREKDALDDLQQSIENVNLQLKEKIQQQQESLSLAVQEAALTQQQEELERRLALANLESKRIKNEISGKEYLAEKQRINREAVESRQRKERAEKWGQQDANMANLNQMQTALDRAQKELARYESVKLRDDAGRDADNARAQQIKTELERRAKEAGFDSLDSWKQFLEWKQKDLAPYVARMEREHPDSSYTRQQRTKLEDIVSNLGWFNTLDQYDQKNKDEVAALNNQGFDDLAKVLQEQLRRGKETTVTGEMEKLRAENAQTVKGLQDTIAQQEKRIEELAIQITSMEARHATELQTLAVNQQNETYLQDQSDKEKAEAEAKKNKKQIRDAIRWASELRREIASYQGKHADKLAVFSDGSVTDNEREAVEQLVGLTKQNGALRDVVGKLIDRIAKSEFTNENTRDFLFAQQERIAGLEGLAQQEADSRDQRVHEANVKELGSRKFKGLSKKELAKLRSAAGIFADGKIATNEQEQYETILELAATNKDLFTFIQRMLSHMEKRAKNDAELHQQILQNRQKLEQLEKRWQRIAKKP